MGKVTMAYACMNKVRDYLLTGIGSWEILI
jgi:hypothetical protein